MDAVRRCETSRVSYESSKRMIEPESNNPFEMFSQWLSEAQRCPSISEANAMTLATSTSDGIPSARFVLLRGYDRSGFKFYSNYESRKGRELQENPRASIVLYWAPLHKQIRVEGHVERLTDSESDGYFASRPRASQLAAHTSGVQSEPIPDRGWLERRLSHLESTYPGPVPRPPNWGGYRLLPCRFEFWLGHSDRLHDRIMFTKLTDTGSHRDNSTSTDDSGWSYQRLAP